MINFNTFKKRRIFELLDTYLGGVLGLQTIDLVQGEMSNSVLWERVSYKKNE